MSGLEDGHLVSVHGLMHEVLLALQTQGEGETGATGSIGGESKSSPAHPPVGSALAYFEAFHLVGSSARWDALREAKKTYGEELGGEEEIVMRAVRRNGAALQFASEVLRGEGRRSTLDLRYHRFSLMPP